MWQALGLTALPYLGGLYGGYVTRHQVKTWYPTLVKPSWRPPNAAFPVVWSCLYTGMGSVGGLFTACIVMIQSYTPIALLYTYSRAAAV